MPSPRITAPTTASGAEMLSVQDMVRRFGTKAAVVAVSFEIDGLHVTGIIGRAGAGKSTLLRMMNRPADTAAGRIPCEGCDQRARQSRCAMIVRQFNLAPRLDVASNMLHGQLNRRAARATVFNIRPRADILRAIEMLDRPGIAERPTTRAGALSGGQRQRLAIARALMQDTRIILADEPIASLGPMNTRIVMDTLRRIKAEGHRAPPNARHRATATA